MAKKPKQNKAYTPPENKVDLFNDLAPKAEEAQAEEAQAEEDKAEEAKAEEGQAEEAKAEEAQVVMVKVKILPLRGIGGYGTPGTECWMPEAEAEKYKRDGYVEILKVEE